jgi:hypothetical protein
VPRDQDAELNDAGRRAVARWAQFPVGVIPRPLVLLGDPFRVEKGFSTGDAKIAFVSGAVEAAAGVPEDAVRPIRPSVVHAGRRPRDPLLVSAAELSAAEFATDRGHQRLPAWRLEAADALGPIWVLTAEARARCWSPPQADGAGRPGPRLLSSGVTAPESRELAVAFIGGGEGLFRYDAEVIETAVAVCVVPLRRMTEHFAQEAAAAAAAHRQLAVAAVGYPRTVQVSLAEPLGGRVLVNLDGTAVPVTAEPVAVPRAVSAS